jgi:hypothetical protein
MSKSSTISLFGGGNNVIPLKRKEHWDSIAFHEFLLSRAHEEFAWGKNDCALFAADGIEAITGVDVARDFRGYNDEPSAWASIKSVCNGSTVDDAIVFIATKFDLCELEHPLMAQRGDLVVIEQESRRIAALVHLNGRHVVAVGEGGLRRYPITEVKRAWHYG